MKYKGLEKKSFTEHKKLFAGILLVFALLSSGFSQDLAPFLIILVLGACLATLVSTNFGLSILIFSMLLSPELEVSQVPQRAVTIRLEDFLVGAVFFTWLARMAILKGVGLFRRSMLNRPLSTYTAILLFSTLFAFQQGGLKGKGAQFFLLKYVEYYVVFFMFFNNVTSKKQVQRFLIFFLITGLCVCFCALNLYGKHERLTAPFEGKAAEPGSLGGYLLIQIAVLLGFLLHSDWPKHRLVLLGLLILMIVTLVLSTSRGALFAFAPLYLAATCLSPRKRVTLMVVFLCVVFLGYQFVPPRILQFILEAFSASQGGKVYTIGSQKVEIGASGAARVETWKFVLSMWREKPIFGYGITGVGIVDSQFVRTLGEVGLVGFSVFIWLLVLIFKAGFRAYRSGDPLTRSLGVGVILATTGLVVQGISANTFIIVRIMEPFWFLVALTLGMTRLSEEASEKKGDTLKVKAA